MSKSAMTYVSATPSAHAAAPGRGRSGSPASDRRRDRVLRIAQRVFIKRGYHAATMDEIAAAAGISKRTLYQLVASKEDLFMALLARHRRPLTLPVETAGCPPREVLFDYLSAWSRHVLSPDSIALTRLIMGEYLRGRTLSRLLDRQTAKPCKDALLDYLAQLRTEAAINIADPEEAAQMLFGMTVGWLHVRMLLGVSKPPTPADLDQRILRAIDLFLGGAMLRVPNATPGPDSLKEQAVPLSHEPAFSA